MDPLIIDNNKRYSRSSSKRLLIIGGLVLIVFVAATITLAVLFANEKNKNDSSSDKIPDSICATPYCIKAADYLLESIDESVEPCEDFYQFSCGTWLENIRIPDDANSVNTFRILDKQLDDNMIDLLASTSNESIELQSVANARHLYSSCTNETNIDAEGVERILSLIDTEFGGWPILQGESWNESTFNFSNLIFRLRQYNYNILYRVGTDVDEKNSSITDIVIGQGSLGLPQRRYFENETDVTIAYRNLIRNLAKELSTSTTTIETDINEMFQFEKDISQYFYTSDEQRARDNETFPTTVADLSEHLNMTLLNFTEYISQLYAFGNVTLEATDVVIVSEIDFLTNVSAIIDITSPRIVQNYFVWRFILDQSSNFPRYYRAAREQFDRIFQGTNAEQTRPTKCAIFVNNNMGMVVSKLYIKRFFDENARNQSLNMIENIRSSFIDLIGSSTWMEEKSRNLAVEKAKAMNQQIGYPEYLSSDNNTKIENDYVEYKFDSSYIGNILKLLQIKTKENLGFLRQPVDHKAWGSLPPTVINAFYEPSQNQITFPAGILQRPFFNKEAPKYLNYGGIGAVIGHEITHGFDDMGRQFDKDGNRIPWWTEKTIEQFNQRKECIIKQYSNYSVPSLHMNSNGNQTQGEDIADNGGIKAAFFAYKQWAKENPKSVQKLPGLTKYSAEQLFFVNFAHIWCIKMTDQYAQLRLLTDPHSLGQFRVIGPTSNFDEFDKAFGCKPGQGNSRVDKCAVW